MSARQPVNRAGRMLFVGRFLGVPIYFAPSWLVIAGLLTVYYQPIISAAVPEVSSSSAYLVAFAFAGCFALCVLGHELGHTAVSLLLGSPVRRVVIFLLGGVSEIERDPERPRDEFLIAAAGPFVSLLLSGGCALGYLALNGHSLPGVLLALLCWSNLVVAVFNLIPGLPLDGGRLLRAGIWAMTGQRLRGTRLAAWSGRVVAILVALSGLVADRSSLGFTGGLICFALAAYLWFGAGQSLRVAEVLDKLPLVDLASLLRPGLLVPADLSVAEALRRVWSGSARGLVLVDSSDTPRAIVDESRIGSVPPDRRPWTQLSAVARPLEAGLILPLGLRGEDLLAALRLTPAHEYLVVNDDGSPAGILSMADLAAVLKGTA